MCADCHSTNLRKNYDLAKDSYDTKWSEIDVSCESCHGPGSNHVAWAQTHKKGSYKPGDGSNGLVVDLKPASGSWASLEPDTGTMHWKGQPRSHNEINTCAPCHSRRHPITSDYQPGQPFLDGYVPSLLEEGVYYPDGQILEEDYEWGSFIQSKMYHEGVTCSDCHDPHTAKLPQVSLNAVCGKCHSQQKFGSEQHTHHKAESAGALCVNCHMTTKTYMVVDARRDHSFRVPRPDFSVAYGTPNACNQCHKDKTKQWAVETVVKWYGPNRRQEAHFVDGDRRRTSRLAERRESADGADHGHGKARHCSRHRVEPASCVSHSGCAARRAIRACGQRRAGAQPGGAVAGTAVAAGTGAFRCAIADGPGSLRPHRSRAPAGWNSSRLSCRTRRRPRSIARLRS